MKKQVFGPWHLEIAFQRSHMRGSSSECCFSLIPPGFFLLNSSFSFLHQASWLVSPMCFFVSLLLSLLRLGPPVETTEEDLHVPRAGERHESLGLGA